MAEVIHSLSDWTPGTVFTPLAPEVRPGWSRFNPSLARRADGALMCNVRSSNYRLGPGGSYLNADADQVIRTENHLVELDADLHPRSTVSLREPSGLTRHLFPVHGYEDVRLFASPNGLGALATVRDREADGLCRIALLDIAPDGQVVSERILVGPDPHRHEKNWTPFEVSGGTLRVIYSWSPLVVATVDLDTGFTSFGEPLATAWVNSRGGAGGARVGDERIFIVHEATTMPDWSRRYLHRFVTLDDDDRPLRASPRLFLLGRGIEFAAGLVLDGEDLLVSFGLEDEEAWIVRLPVDALLDRLETALQPVAKGALR